MRAFILLAIVAVARADVGGYSYGTGSNGGFALENNNGGASNGEQSVGNNDARLDYNNAPVSSNEFNKEFFTYTAPEADFDDGKSLGELANSLKRNLKVVFIKGPENTGLENAALNLAKSAIDSRTAIYVLNKQTDLSDLANKLQNLNKNSNQKPDVHFVKYRTPEDAAHAQRTIQQEYERLGGPSQAHNGGVAPVLDFASRVQQRERFVSRNVGTRNGGDDLIVNQPANSYIPPAVSRPSSGGSVNPPSPTYLPSSK
jgi:hypothetical protein